MAKILKVMQVFLLCFMAITAISVDAYAGTDVQIEKDARAMLRDLCASDPAAAQLAKAAKGILVFPEITKGGFIVGGQYGEGALFKGGKRAGFYNTVAGSFGLQAGLQQYGYAMFFMTDAAMKYLDNSAGWEVGVGPSIVIVDQGIARSLTTTTAQSDVYAFFYNQSGLMAGMGLQGSKITKMSPKKGKK